MNALVLQFKKVTPLCLIVFALGSLALSPKAQAAPASEKPKSNAALPNPPAPGVLNTRDGQSCMPFVTTGVANSAFGAYSMFSLTVGNFNTAVGVAALDLNNADSNTAVGAAALLLNTDGTENTATGTAALQITPQLTATRLTARLFKAENSPAEFVNERGTFSRANDFRC